MRSRNWYYRLRSYGSAEAGRRRVIRLRIRAGFLARALDSGGTLISLVIRTMEAGSPETPGVRGHRPEETIQCTDGL